MNYFLKLVVRIDRFNSVVNFVLISFGEIEGGEGYLGKRSW
jgi:hypothetical protein